MTIIRNYNFNTTQVTAIVNDNSGYLWLGFSKNSDGVCILRKVSVHDPNQVYYEIEIEADEIKVLHVYGSFLYVGLDDDTYLFQRYSLTSPLTISASLSRPIGINEDPIAIVNDGTYLYFLLPGISPENSKILKYRISTCALNTTIDLSTINNAIDFTYTNSNLWVITNESPSKLIRVYDDGGYTYDVTS